MSDDPAGELAVDRIRPAYAQVASQLRDKILNGALRPGDRLPVEVELAELFGVSRSTVREALRQLASHQLIETSRGPTGGSRVAQPSAASLEDYLTSSMGLLATAGEIPRAALLEARTMFEPSAAGLAARRRTPMQLDDLTAQIFDPEGDPHDLIVQRTRGFHLSLLEAAGNPVMQLLAGPVYEVLGTVYIEKASSPDFWGRVDREHRSILAAVRSGDAEAAEAAMRDHLGDLRDLYRELER
ncbi:FadR/GntR family transcriptional regulator [Euzebya tangerina]|uniref:FadR/GntR family transcriptional regulator n=1 Tax=Euzebya tangerina TaxID=591198 RepID=UPI000E31EB58|nr:FadR/GntR family transcriptional regulator [Euzebya tangerina]